MQLSDIADFASKLKVEMGWGSTSQSAIPTTRKICFIVIKKKYHLEDYAIFMNRKI